MAERPAGGGVRGPSLGQRRLALRLAEYGVVAVVLLLLVGGFLRKIERLQAQTERLTMERTVRALRTAVELTAVLSADGQQRPPAALRPGGNPMDLLDQVPANYRGTRAGIDPASVPGGHWYFDRLHGLLIYRVANPRFFVTALSGPPRARFRIVEQSQEVSPHLALEPVDPYRWRVHPR